MNMESAKQLIIKNVRNNTINNIGYKYYTVIRFKGRIISTQLTNDKLELKKYVSSFVYNNSAIIPNDIYYSFSLRHECHELAEQLADYFIDKGIVTIEVYE